MHQEESRPRFAGVAWGRVFAFIAFAFVMAIALLAVGAEQGRVERVSAVAPIAESVAPCP